MKTTSAKASKQCKQELKAAFPETKFSVKSDNFAGGNSIYVRWTDGPSVDHVKAIVDKYQYGNFNGMIDLYEMTNQREDIPQVKYAMTKRYYSDEAVAIAEMHLKNRYGLEEFSSDEVAKQLSTQAWTLRSKELNNSFIVDNNGVLLLFTEYATPQLDEGYYGVYIKETASSRYYLIGDSGFPRGFNTFDDLYTFFHVKEEQALPDFIKIDTESVPDYA